MPSTVHEAEAPRDALRCSSRSIDIAIVRVAATTCAAHEIELSLNPALVASPAPGAHLLAAFR